VPDRKPSISPISALDENVNPQNTEWSALETLPGPELLRGTLGCDRTGMDGGLQHCPRGQKRLRPVKRMDSKLNGNVSLWFSGGGMPITFLLAARTRLFQRIRSKNITEYMV